LPLRLHLPLCPRTVRVGAHNRGVNPGIFVIGFAGSLLKHSQPHSRLCPVPKPRVNFAVVLEAFGSISLGNARPVANTASTNKRLSLAVTPTEPCRPGSRFLIRSHWSSWRA
jgi:hypothetical protein